MDILQLQHYIPNSYTPNTFTAGPLLHTSLYVVLFVTLVSYAEVCCTLIIIMAVPIESWQEFEKHVLHYKGSKVVVVDFWAASCGDCIVLAPFFYTLAEKNKQCDFYEVDVEEEGTSEVKNWAKIKKLPTIKFYKYGECIETIEGGAQGKISAAVAKHKNA